MPSTPSAPRARDAAREARDAMRTAEASYDMQHEVWDLAVADQVAHAMGELPEEERRAIELAYFDGRTYREVAATARPARGHGQEPDPQRHAAHARRPRRRRRSGGSTRDVARRGQRAPRRVRPRRRRRRRARTSSRCTRPPAHAAGPSSTACARWRAPSATRWNRSPRDCGPASPAGCPSVPGTRSRLPCRSWAMRAGPPSVRLPTDGSAAGLPPSPPSAHWRSRPPRWPSCSASGWCRPTTRSRTSRPPRPTRPPPSPSH